MKYLALISILILSSCNHINQLLGPEGALIVERTAEGIAEVEKQEATQETMDEK